MSERSPRNGIGGLQNPYKVAVFLPAPGSSWLRVYINGKTVYAAGNRPT